MTLFDFASQLSRESARQTQESLPSLSPEEHAFIEKLSGLSLSNEEAQLYLKSASLMAAFNQWSAGRKPD